MVGIVHIEKYLPALRIKAEEFKKAWGNVGPGFKEKCVMDIDEDCLTMGMAAGEKIFDLHEQYRSKIELLTLASTNYPYAEKVMSTTICKVLGISPECFASEHGNSTLAGTAAFLEAWRYVSLYPKSNSMVITADAPRGNVKEPGENPYGAGAAAVILGASDVICVIEDAASAMAEFIGERFRPVGEVNVRNMGIEAYSRKASESVITNAVSSLLWRVGRSVNDYKYAVINNFNLKTAASIAGKLGFKEEQIKQGNTFGYTGDTGAAADFIGLYDVLMLAKPGEHIMLCSYGGGSAGHAVSLTAAEGILEWQKSRPINKDQVKYIDYYDYLKYRGILL